jgi:hypothetical protein
MSNHSVNIELLNNISYLLYEVAFKDGCIGMTLKFHIR